MNLKAGKTPLMSAALGAADETVAFLLSKGASPDLMDKDGQTALVFAIYSSCSSTIDLLALPNDGARHWEAQARWHHGLSDHAILMATGIRNATSATRPCNPLHSQVAPAGSSGGPQGPV